jgi:heat-inducible transcriptional repressor
VEISERKKKILTAVVEEYVRTAEPVGSKAIAQNADLGCSSATIRNELAELVSMGYLEQPHTSAGRIPSPKGYRMYVNELMHRENLSREETEEINQGLSGKLQKKEDLMGEVGRLTSSLTNYPAYAVTTAAPATIKRFDLIYIDEKTMIIVLLLSNDTVKNKLVHLPFSVDQGTVTRLATVFNTSFTGITEDQITGSLVTSAEQASGDTYGLAAAVAAYAIEILKNAKAGAAFVTGAGHLLSQPEFRDPDKASQVMHYLSDSSHVMDLSDFSEVGEVKVLIGPENVADELRDSSVMMATYNIGDNMQGLIGVVGPTRMDYSKVAAKLSYIAAGLSKLLSTSDAPPGLNNKLIIGDDTDE